MPSGNLLVEVCTRRRETIYQQLYPGKNCSQREVQLGIVLSEENAFNAAQFRFIAQFRELRLSWTHNSLMSEGVGQFVLEFMPVIRSH
ncbi:unnamed protein product [Anisakis simplex]|uniref:DUF2617 family protein n=1 Tax=Anisakis simplex TaxID=6269 RepID=A0A0M3JEU5_ANISI|nr:unnamed protein product [Anisakis simplex]